jgi:hypothetical protein
MTIKINVGVNKKIGLPDYGSAGSHCNIEIEADNSILDNANQFLQRVKDAYEVARQSVELELSHHCPGNARQSSANHSHEPAQQRQDYRSNHSSNDNRNIVSEKQLTYIWQLTKGIKGLDKRTLEKYCDSKFGKASTQLSSREASALIDDLKAAKSGRGGLSA